MHLRGAGASCVLSLGRFQGDLCGVCLLRFAKCVASQWPTLSPVLRGFVFGRVFGSDHSPPPLVASPGPTTAQVKARLFQTHRREYENFTQKPGESVEDLFGHFQSIINKLRVNKSATDHLPSDHEQALKLLHTLDPKVWASTTAAIVEGHRMRPSQ